jgi:N-acetylneuraminic acid mutarotase
VIDHYVYLCAGTQRPDTLDDDLPALFRIDAGGAGKMAARVKTCRPFPGAARAIHASAASDGALLVFGGALVQGGKVVNSQEVWRYRPKTDLWDRLPDAPCAVRGWSAVAPTGSRTVLLIGGYRDDEWGIPPGFRRTVWAFDTVSGRWSDVGELPFAFGTSPFGLTADGLLLAAGGEDAPRHRAGNTLRGQILEMGKSHE